jgi:ribosomal RNA-processing protein 9
LIDVVDIRGPMSSIECVSLMNEEFFVSGCQDGSLQLWSATKKKPLVSVPLAHGLSSSSSTANWITSIVALKYRFIEFFSQI